MYFTNSFQTQDSGESFQRELSSLKWIKNNYLYEFNLKLVFQPNLRN